MTSSEKKERDEMLSKEIAKLARRPSKKPSGVSRSTSNA